MMPMACIIRWLGLWVCSCPSYRGRFFLYSNIVLDRMEPVGRGGARYGHGLEELTDGFMECTWHVF